MARNEPECILSAGMKSGSVVQDEEVWNQLPLSFSQTHQSENSWWEGRDKENPEVSVSIRLQKEIWRANIGVLPSNIVYNENHFRIEVIFKEGETPNSGLRQLQTKARRESCLLFQRRRKTSEGWNKMTDGIHFPGEHFLKLAPNATTNALHKWIWGRNPQNLGFCC